LSIDGSIKGIVDAIRGETGRHAARLSAEKLVKQFNSNLPGWANDFDLGPVSKACGKATEAPPDERGGNRSVEPDVDCAHSHSSDSSERPIRAQLNQWTH